MKTIKAIKRYYDKEKGRDVYINDIYETSDERAKLIVSNGYAVVVENTEQKPKTNRKKKVG